MGLRDIGLFLRSAYTDASIRRLRPTLGSARAIEAVYRANADPWASASLSYRYQRRKYEVLASLLPARRFKRALDLGCGLGLMARHLIACADEVLGVDIAPSAVSYARALHESQSNVQFEVHDLLNLPSEWNGTFDLVVVVDVLCYLFPSDEALLKAIAIRVADLLTRGGICLLTHHYFSGVDPESRLSRRIHNAFAWSPRFTISAEHRRPFYLVALLNAQRSCCGTT